MSDTIVFKRPDGVIEHLLQKWLSTCLWFLTKGVLICALSLVALTLMRSYTGYLFSEHVATPSQLPFTDINTFVDCVETERCTFAVATSYVSLMKLYLNSNGSSLMSRLKAVDDENRFKAYRLEDLLNLVLNDHSTYIVGFMTDTDFYYAAQHQEQCKYYIVKPGLFQPSSNTFPILKNSIIREELDLMAKLWLIVSAR